MEFHRIVFWFKVPWNSMELWIIQKNVPWNLKEIFRTSMEFQWTLINLILKKIILLNLVLVSDWRVCVSFFEKYCIFHWIQCHYLNIWTSECQRKWEKTGKKGKPLLPDCASSLTHWCLDNLAAIWQTTFSKAFLEWRCMNFAKYLTGVCS